MIPRATVPAALHYTRRADSRWVVALGDEVSRGSVLASGMCFEHAAAGGVVVHVDHQRIVIRTRHDHRQELLDPIDPRDPANRQAVLRRIQEAGIVGLGGGGFPTHLKLLAAARGNVQTLIVNAVECEPGIHCDAELIQHELPVILEGIDVVRNLLGVTETYIGCSRSTFFELPAATTELIEPVEPTDGAERYLVSRLTGTDLPMGVRPVDSGSIVLNVGTLHAIARAMAGEALIERVATVFGENLRVLIGSPLKHFGAGEHFRVGGELSGQVVGADAAITKETNAVAVSGQFKNLPCIRCGACDTVCPEKLPVASLVGISSSEGVLNHAALGCISCGLCNPVCPSDIDVAGTIRNMKQVRQHELTRASAAQRSLERSTQHEGRRLVQEAAQAERRAERLAKLQAAEAAPPVDPRA